MLFTENPARVISKIAGNRGVRAFGGESQASDEKKSESRLIGELSKKSIEKFEKGKMVKSKQNENDSIMQNFAMKIRSERVKNKITQEKLSEKIGITTVHLRNIESGRNIPNYVVWLKLCTELGINVEEFQRDYIVPWLKNENANFH